MVSRLCGRSSRAESTSSTICAPSAFQFRQIILPRSLELYAGVEPKSIGGVVHPPAIAVPTNNNPPMIILRM